MSHVVDSSLLSLAGSLIRYTAFLSYSCWRLFPKIPVGNLQCATGQPFSCLFRHPRDSTMDILGVLMSNLSQGAPLRAEGDQDFQVGARLLQACKGSSYSAASQSREILGGQVVG